MNILSQLKELREQMLEELTQFPQYRAVKAMDQLIVELSNIDSATQKSDSEDMRKQISAAVERRIPSAVAASSPKVTPYVPRIELRNVALATAEK
jgi:hypothetical protein